MKSTIITVSASSAIMQRGGQDFAYLTRDDRLGSPHEGWWEARPIHDALTVGKHFPHFTTRAKAADWIDATY